MFLSLMVVLSVVSFSQIATLEVSYVDPTDIVIDGAGTDWSAIDPIDLAVDVLGSSPVEPDFKPVFRAAWSDDNLYLFFEVKDDIVVEPSVITKPWNSDMLEFGFTFEVDSIYDVSKKGDPTASPDDSKLFINPTVGQELLFYQLKDSAKTIEFAWVAVTGGYNVELKIPFAEIYAAADVQAGDSMRMEITSGDSEDGTVSKHQLRWSSAGDINKSMEGLGRLYFIGPDDEPDVPAADISYVDSNSIFIDGVASDWSTILPAIVPEVNILGTTPAEDDFKASFKSAWNEAYLYILCEVTDQTVVGANNSAKVWLGDHIEMVFSFEVDDIYNVSKKGDPEASPDDAKIFISPTVDNPLLYYQLKDSTLSVEYALVEVTGGYNVEAKIPFRKLYLDAAVDNQTTMRFDITIGDSEDGDTRAHQFRWSSVGDINTVLNGLGKLTFIGRSTSVGSSLDQKGLSIYPNPAADYLQLNHRAGIMSVNVYNIAGQVVKTIRCNSPGLNMDVSDLKAGLYMITVTTENGQRETARVIIR